ncbi:LysR substrate-binding domain-containing protein [Mesorhizobium sp. LjNodule214]|uniref:LysR substrate-binding domain-containing protein n=1 Tax=Mesorhizobium sp. LjNodule214 TaxID=3342252 RepID=UPI003ECD4452
MARRKLPPLNALVTFEEVVRRRSCSLAAAKLGSTQSAVSKQIRSIEEFVGLPLFARTSLGMIPNEAGAQLIDDVQPLLDALEHAIDRASQEAKHRKVVIVRVLSTLCNQWLFPRMKDFIARHPDIDIQFSTLRIDTRDRGTSELEILFGSGPWLDCDSAPLVGRKCILIAPPSTSPDLSFAELIGLPRIVHAQARDAWSDFFACRKAVDPYEMNPVSTYDIYQVMLSAVQIGMGIALVPLCLVEEELARGEVFNPGGLSYESKQFYHVIVPHRARPLSEPAQILHKWLLSHAEP